MIVLCQEVKDSMISIQAFSKLCKCTKQKIRYYDCINLLKPVFVESSTRYRYYDSSQAMDYFKIKQLQQIGCTIKEIKTYLNQSDEEILKLIDQKILYQQNILEKTLELKETYLDKKMKTKESICDYENNLKLFAVASSTTLTFRQTGPECTLVIQNGNSQVLSEFINQMQENPYIQLDLNDLVPWSKYTWTASPIYTDWTKDSNFYEMFPDQEIKPLKTLCLFIVPKTIDLFDIDAILGVLESKGSDRVQTIFAVSYIEHEPNQLVYLTCHK